MGQKCPICRRVVPTDGVTPGGTIICPGCGTGIVVEQEFAAAPDGAGDSSSQGAGAVGSYSLKFNGPQLRKESIFVGEPGGRADDAAGPQKPDSDFSAAEPATKPKPTPKPEPRPAPKPAPVHSPERHLDMDPDSTIGFGGIDDFLLGQTPKAPPTSSSPTVREKFSQDIFEDLLFEPGDRHTGRQAGNVAPAVAAAADEDWLKADIGPDAGAMPESAFSDDNELMTDSPFGDGLSDAAETAPTEKFDQELSVALGDDDFLSGLDDDGGSRDAEPLIDDLDYEVPPEEAAPLRASEAPTRGLKKQRPTSAGARRRSRLGKDGTRKGRRNLGPILIVPVVIILVGAILGQTDYGYFGINLVTGNVGASDSYYKTIDSSVQITGDSRGSFLENISRLEKAYASRNSSENLNELLGALNRYRERYPDAFMSDPGMTARLNDLRNLASRKDSSAAGMSQVTELLGMGKYSEARAVLDNMMAASAQDVDALYYYGKIALGTGKADEAQKYFELALIRNPGLISAKYFLAESHVAQNKLIEAKVILSEIANKDPRHLPSRVLTAKIALTELNYDEAARLAKEIITLGTPGSDVDEIFQAHRVLARVNQVEGQDVEQLVELRGALELKPANEQTAIETGRLMIKLNKRTEALDLLKPCRESGCVSEDFLLVFAEAAYLDEKIELAEAAVAQGVQKYPESPRFGVLVGRYHLSLNHFRSAVASLEGALAVKADCTEAYELLAEAQRKEGKLQEASDTLTRGMGIVGDKPHLLTMLAAIQIESKDIGGAEISLRKAVQLDPENDEAQLRLGMVIKSQGRNDEAAAILNVLEKKRALDFDGTIALADAYLSVGDTIRARDILEKLAADNPDSPEAANAWGRAVGVARDYDKAVDILTKVRNRFPNNGQTNYYLGDVYMAQKNFHDAITYYSDAVKIEGENYAFRLSLAKAYVALNTVDGETEARKQLDVIAAAYAASLVSKEEQDAEVYLLRGRILFAREKYAQAMKDFEDALSLAPTRRDIMVDFGKSLYEMSRYDDASAYFKQVVTSDAQNPDANYFLGRIYLRAGDTNRATNYLVEAVKRNPSRFPEAHRLLGLIYKDKGLRSLARDSFNRYLKYTPDRKSSEAVEVQRMLEKETY